MQGRGPKIITCLGALGISAALAGLLARQWRDHVMPRRDPSKPFRELYLISEDGTGIAARLIGGGGTGAVVLAHPAVTGQRYSSLVGLAEKLSRDFDVYTFDFRGHGKSGGCLEMDLDGPVVDLRAVIEHARQSGYAWIGVIGFSLGGMASFIYTSRYADIDALAIVGTPPRLPDIEPYRRWMPVWSVFLRFLGARFSAVGRGCGAPIDLAREFPTVPLLIVHGEREAFYRRDDLDEMLRLLDGKAEFWENEGAAHTELADREDDLIRWLVEKAGAQNPR
jgi:pimeloyl-ACP methyl ester carboxylesterase